MRILLLVDCYLPSTKSSAKLIHDLAVEIYRRGNEVVIAAPDDTIVVPSELSTEDGMIVLRVRTRKIKGASKILRAINEWRLSSVMWKAGYDFFHDNPCKLVVYYSPTIFFGDLVENLKKLWGCQSYLILRDIFPQWAVDAGVLRKSSLPYKFFRYKELKQYKAANIIGVQSPANLEYFAKNILSGRNKLEVLYNWTTLSEESIPCTNYREVFGLKDKVVFFYGGNIGVAQDMDNLIRLAESLREESRAYFLLVGEGSEVPRLKEAIRVKGLKNIAIYPAVDQKTYLGMLSEFDVGLISLDKGLKTQNFPGKMLGYMYFAMPILASVNPGNDLKDVLEDCQAGLVSLNGDDQLLRKNAVQLLRGDAFRQRIGANGRTLLENKFCVTPTAEQILSHFR